MNLMCWSLNLSFSAVGVYDTGWSLCSSTCNQDQNTDVIRIKRRSLTPLLTSRVFITKQRNRWWLTFRGQVIFNPRHEEMVKTSFETAAIDRIPDFMHRAKTNPRYQLWMTEEIRRQFEQWIASPEFQAKLVKKKKNRVSGSAEEGRIPGTHAMGREGFAGFSSRSLEKTRDLSVPDLVISSKKKKSGSFVSKKFEKIFDVFYLQEASPRDAARHPCRRLATLLRSRWRVRQEGKSLWHGVSCHHVLKPAAARHSSAETYAPGIVTQLTQTLARDRQVNLEVTEELRRELKDNDDRISRLERLVSERLGNTPPETCNPAYEPLQRLASPQRSSLWKRKNLFCRVH